MSQKHLKEGIFLGIISYKRNRWNTLQGCINEFDTGLGYYLIGNVIAIPEVILPREMLLHAIHQDAPETDLRFFEKQDTTVI